MKKTIILSLLLSLIASTIDQSRAVQVEITDVHCDADVTVVFHKRTNTMSWPFSYPKINHETNVKKVVKASSIDNEDKLKLSFSFTNEEINELFRQNYEVAIMAYQNHVPDENVILMSVPHYENYNLKINEPFGIYNRSGKFNDFIDDQRDVKGALPEFVMDQELFSDLGDLAPSDTWYLSRDELLESTKVYKIVMLGSSPRCSGFSR